MSKTLLYFGPSGIGDWCFIYPSLPALLTKTSSTQLTLIIPYQNSGNELLKNNPLIKEVIYLNRETKGIGLLRYFFRWLSILTKIRKKNYSTLAVSYLSNQVDFLLLASLSGIKKRIGVLTTNSFINKVAFNEYIQFTGKIDKVNNHQAYASDIHSLMDVPPMFGRVGDKNRQKILQHFKIKTPYLVFGIGGGRNALWRFWRPEYYARLADEFKNYSNIVLLGGGNDDAQQAEIIMQSLSSNKIINLVNQINMSDAVDIINGASCVIGNDSGITNIAATNHIKCLCLYGPTYPEKTGAALLGAIPVVTDTPPSCMPCFNDSLKPSSTDKPLHCTNRSCLHSLSPEEVINAFQKVD